MSRVALPVPHAVIDNIGDVHFDADNWRGISLFTTTQVEAYADAMVREALELAAQTCENQVRATTTLDGESFYIALGQAARAIRALIPPQQ